MKPLRDQVRALCVLGAVICAVSLAFPAVAMAQKTQGEIELEQAIRAQRDRRDQAAATQAMHDEANAMRARAQSDAAAAKRNALDAPQRALDSRLAAQAEANARAADEERYQAGQRRAMDELRRREYRLEAWNYARWTYDHHDYVAALAAFNNLFAQGETAYRLRALVKAHLGLYEAAQADLALEEQESPKSPYTVAARAEILELLGDTAGAATAFDAAAAEAPYSSEVLYPRGVFRIRQRNYAGAVADLEIALRDNSNNKDARANTEAALTVAKSGLAGSPVPPSTPLYDADPPVTACDRVAASPLDDARPRGWRGVYDDALDAVAAIPICQAQVQAAPLDIRAKLNLARVLVAAKRCVEAKPYLDQAMEAKYAAAFLINGSLKFRGCEAIAPASVTAEVQKAYELHSGHAAYVLYHGYDEKYSAAIAAKDDAASTVIYKARQPYEYAMIKAYGDLARQGDGLGIEMMAEFAHEGMFNSLWVSHIMACKVRSYRSCKDY